MFVYSLIPSKFGKVSQTVEFGGVFMCRFSSAKRFFNRPFSLEKREKMNSSVVGRTDVKRRYLHAFSLCTRTTVVSPLFFMPYDYVIF